MGARARAPAALAAALLLLAAAAVARADLVDYIHSFGVPQHRAPLFAVASVPECAQECDRNYAWCSGFSFDEERGCVLYAGCARQYDLKRTFYGRAGACGRPRAEEFAPALGPVPRPSLGALPESDCAARNGTVAGPYCWAPPSPGSHPPSGFVASPLLPHSALRSLFAVDDDECRAHCNAEGARCAGYVLSAGLCALFEASDSYALATAGTIRARWRRPPVVRSKQMDVQPYTYPDGDPDGFVLYKGTAYVPAGSMTPVDTVFGGSNVPWQNCATACLSRSSVSPGRPACTGFFMGRSISQTSQCMLLTTCTLSAVPLADYAVIYADGSDVFGILPPDKCGGSVGGGTVYLNKYSVADAPRTCANPWVYMQATGTTEGCARICTQRASTEGRPCICFSLRGGECYGCDTCISPSKTDNFPTQNPYCVKNTCAGAGGGGGGTTSGGARTRATPALGALQLASLALLLSLAIGVPFL